MNMDAPFDKFDEGNDDGFTSMPAAGSINMQQ